MRRTSIACYIPLPLLFLLVHLAVSSYSQPLPVEAGVWDATVKLPKTCNLSPRVNETSGLIYFDGSLWTFNDSGGKPEIYRINSEDGSILQTVVLKGADNIDWEDITQDADFIYAGDFGNNRGDRRDLRIYKVSKEYLTRKQKGDVPVEVISFRYADQADYNVQNRSNNFDCESIVSLGDSLLLFSKNWVNGHTRMYRLPKEAGDYVTAPVSEFDAAGLVTGADYHAATGMLALIGYTNGIPFVYLFPGFNGADLSASASVRVNFPQMARIQTEGICFVSDNELAVSAESTRQDDQAVYRLDLDQLFKEGSVKEHDDRH